MEAVNAAVVAEVYINYYRLGIPYYYLLCLLVSECYNCKKSGYMARDCGEFVGTLLHMRGERQNGDW